MFPNRQLDSSSRRENSACSLSLESRIRVSQFSHFIAAETGTRTRSNYGCTVATLRQLYISIYLSTHARPIINSRGHCGRRHDLNQINRVSTRGSPRRNGLIALFITVMRGRPGVASTNGYTRGQTGELQRKRTRKRERERERIMLFRGNYGNYNARKA